jgi:hypothetical protein
VFLVPGGEKVRMRGSGVSIGWLLTPSLCPLPPGEREQLARCVSNRFDLHVISSTTRRDALSLAPWQKREVSAISEIGIESP